MVNDTSCGTSKFSFVRVRRQVEPKNRLDQLTQPLIAKQPPQLDHRRISNFEDGKRCFSVAGAQAVTSSLVTARNRLSRLSINSDSDIMVISEST